MSSPVSSLFDCATDTAFCCVKKIPISSASVDGSASSGEQQFPGFLDQRNEMHVQPRLRRLGDVVHRLLRGRQGIFGRRDLIGGENPVGERTGNRRLPVFEAGDQLALGREISLAGEGQEARALDQLPAPLVDLHDHRQRAAHQTPQLADFAANRNSIAA